MTQGTLCLTSAALLLCLCQCPAFGDPPTFIGEIPARSYLSAFDVDDAGNIVALDALTHQVERISRDGTLLTVFGSAGTNPGQIGSPGDIALDRAGNVYVSDYVGFSRIQVFSCNGRLLRFMTVPAGGGRIAVDLVGNVYVGGGTRISRLAPDGTSISWGSPGTGNGQFGWIGALAVSSTGTLYVCDGGNNRIQYFSADGQFLGTWGTYGNGSGQFGYGTDVAVGVSGVVYIADGDNNRVQEFTAGGAFLNSWGSPASGPGQFNYPSRIAVDANSVYVLDNGNNRRILRFGRGNFVALYADPEATRAPTGIPRNVLTPLYIVATTGGATSGGITGAEFRIEVTNPAGYWFEYAPPAGASVIGELLDTTPIDPSDPRGVTILFNACQPGGPRNAGDRVSLGTLSLYNAFGGVTDLVVKRKNPPNNASMPCARLYRCDAPLLTPVCMSETVEAGVVSRVTLQADFNPPPQFSTEVLDLDTKESPEFGAAGPVATCQALQSNESYLVTVTGTLSLWDASRWGLPPDVICGFPEATPQKPSAWTTNGWVGADAEVIFSVPLAPNGDCDELDSQGFPRHPGRFLIDTGTGFSHMEPLGGQPSAPAPSHVYKYLLQGQGKPVRFSYLDDSTADNYGVLMITVEHTTTAEVASQERSTALTTFLPNLPDPFNPSTQVRYNLAVSGQVRLGVYDVSGRLVRLLFEGLQAAGYQSVVWDGRQSDGTQVPSGVYFARVVSARGSGTEKMILLK